MPELFLLGGKGILKGWDLFCFGFSAPFSIGFALFDLFFP
jgi:hypothetical protein